MDDPTAGPGPRSADGPPSRFPGLREDDLRLVEGRPLPDDAWPRDRAAQPELPGLVRYSLALPAADRRRLRERARSLPAAPPVLPREPSVFERCPPGPGGLLVRMLALRNLGPTSASKVMFLLSGVYKAASTIGLVGRGTRSLDAELLRGFAAVLGVPVAVPAALAGTGVTGPDPAPEVLDTAGLLWDVRRLGADAVRGLLP
ncbi:hypothetical protein SUDANB121_00124 [Nocardiopsis dassonvillei]|uniref:hypothetical protein n=1 Tax=Nocardiopsis dassonvillei TaxID=2014 RepID=UPI003F569262